ncbi:hypothetical protein [Chaetoceros sp. DNA virus 7]|uniref:Viral protein 1 n=1 Tax=Chaetoceros protobacilladnavirus 2 TaxID=3052702 RepID=VP1_CPBDV|nr:hypothetical protein [Chaetoceros sp. DNA virus 7]W6JHZ8.1 RecName: Full=Viral protein 1; Short=VP1 [Protobacilladnavirus chaetoc]BAO48206.1 hypothetical protein [Chaetoceros sp. DNA virus 7]
MNVKGASDKAQLAMQAEWEEVLAPEGALAVEEASSVLKISDDERRSYAAYIDNIIQENEIDVVYGHSRGAAIASELESDVQIIGLDGAMVIANDQANFLNIRQDDSEGYGFDRTIAGPYENTVIVKGGAFHKVAVPEGYHTKKPKASQEALERAKARKHNRARHIARAIDRLTARKTDKELEEIYWRERRKKNKNEFSKALIEFIEEQLL